MSPRWSDGDSRRGVLKKVLRPSLTVGDRLACSAQSMYARSSRPAITAQRLPMSAGSVGPLLRAIVPASSSIDRRTSARATYRLLEMSPSVFAIMSAGRRTSCAKRQRQSLRGVQGHVWETFAENQGCAAGFGTGVSGVSGSRIAVSPAHTAVRRCRRATDPSGRGRIA